MSLDALKTYLDSLPEAARIEAKKAVREYCYAKDPILWARDVLEVTLDPWQRELVLSPPGSRTIALTHRQAGKTTAASVALSHQMKYGTAGFTNLVIAPTARQSSEVVRRTRQFLVKAGTKLQSDNAFSLVLPTGSRVLGLPGSDDASIRGLSVEGLLIEDESARCSDQLYEAATPMLLRHASTSRLMLLSTAWAAGGHFYKVWSEGDEKDWRKIQAFIDDCSHLTPEQIERERRSMPEASFRREYMGEFDQTDSRFFSLTSVDDAFGAVLDATPEPLFGDDDPERIVERAMAFKDPFAEGASF